MSILRLIDGPLVIRRECRSVVVRKMGADLVRLDAFRNENDAMRALIATEKYSAFEVIRYLDDARQVAAQDVVTAEMVKS